MTLRVLTVGLLLGGFLVGGGPAVAAPADEPAVSLVVGLRADTDVVGDLAHSVDVVGSTALTGAVAVDVPANQVTRAADALRRDPAVAYVERDQVARIAAVTPDDPAFGQQWGIAKAGVDAAWDTTRGAGGIVVAVVDTGVRKLPDFAARVLPGHDFVNDDSNADDDQGHGTMTAGVIAAGGDNGVGIAGICWLCKILPVKVLDSTGTGSYSDIAEGVRWAADRGADIINLSLGGSEDSQLLRGAVAYAAGKGALVIAAAGNNGSSKPHYPAAIPAVLAVGASTSGDTRYSWSNYGGSWVDIAAPGCNPAQARDGTLGQFCGTSSATPFVSGVAALLASTSPTPTAAMIRAALTSSARGLSGTWVATSSGRVSAPAALAALPVGDDAVDPVTSFVSPGGNALVRGTVAVVARASDDIGIAKVQLLAGGRVVGTDRVAPYGFGWRTSGRGATVTLVLRAFDRGGNVATATRRVAVDNWGPSVRITSGPAGGTRHVRETKYVTAVAADRNGVSRLELLVDGRVTQRYLGAGHRFPVRTWQHGDVMTVQVRARDRAGNVRYTPARTWYR
jgi:thermitase